MTTLLFESLEHYWLLSDYGVQGVSVTIRCCQPLVGKSRDPLAPSRRWCVGSVGHHLEWPSTCEEVLSTIGTCRAMVCEECRSPSEVTRHFVRKPQSPSVAKGRGVRGRLVTIRNDQALVPKSRSPCAESSKVSSFQTYQWLLVAYL